VTAFAEQPGALLARGVCRAFLASGLSPVVEFSPAPGLRVDVIALGADGRVTIVECKASLADWRADAKWAGYLDWCDAFFFAAPPDFPFEVLPPDEGLFAADPFGAEMLRAALPRTLAPARRRALTLRLARAAAERLRRAQDPGLGLTDGAADRP
jgi:hypothetical protein